MSKAVSIAKEQVSAVIEAAMKKAMAAGMLKALMSKDTPDDDIMNHGKISC